MTNTPIIEYYTSGQIKKSGQTINGQKERHWIVYHENGNKYLDGHFDNNRHAGKWLEWYENGQLAEDGEYVNGEYFVYNFWLETGEQILKNGTGKTVKRFGAGDVDIIEQYFENGKFLREKRI